MFDFFAMPAFPLPPVLRHGRTVIGNPVVQRIAGKRSNAARLYYLNYPKINFDSVQFTF